MNKEEFSENFIFREIIFKSFFLRLYLQFNTFSLFEILSLSRLTFCHFSFIIIILRQWSSHYSHIYQKIKTLLKNIEICSTHFSVQFIFFKKRFFYFFFQTKWKRQMIVAICIHKKKISSGFSSARQSAAATNQWHLFSPVSLDCDVIVSVPINESVVLGGVESLEI